jgi:hypothetical protein
MTGSALSRRLGVVALLLAIQLSTSMPANAQDGARAPAWLPNAISVLNRQRERPVAHASRQAALVESRIQSTRGLRFRQRNVDDSTLRLRFDGGGADRSAVLDSRQYRGAEKHRQRRRFGTWFAGDVVMESAGVHDPRRSAFNSNGVAAGVDMRLGKRVVVGNAIGGAFDRVGVGPDASLASRTLSSTTYGSFAASGESYVDTAVGTAVTTYSGDYGQGARASGSGQEIFGSARVSRQFRRDRLTLRPYGRGRVGSTRFSPGQQNTGLAGERASGSSMQLGVGVAAQGSWKAGEGAVRPRATLELNRALKRTSATVLHVLEDDFGSHVVDPAKTGSGRVSFSGGVDWVIDDKTSLKGEYRMSTSARAFDPVQAVTGSFRVKF